MSSRSLVSLETMLASDFSLRPALSGAEWVEMTEEACRGGVYPRPREGLKPSPTFFDGLTPLVSFRAEREILAV